MPLIVAAMLVNLAAASGANCDLSAPPSSAGETQAHGTVIYVYPRNPDIDDRYSGCQIGWFKDDDHFRKLGVTHFISGVVDSYDSININGEVAYHCQYTSGVLAAGYDGRCPEPGSLMNRSYQAGCFSKATLNSSNSYEPASADCELK